VAAGESEQSSVPVRRGGSAGWDEFI